MENEIIEETPSEPEMDREMFGKDTKLTKFVVAPFFDKGLLEGRTMRFKIGDKLVSHNKTWDTYSLNVLTTDGYENEYMLRISKTNVNQLIDYFGEALKDWIGNEIGVTGKRFQSVRRNGEKIEGVMLELSK